MVKRLFATIRLVKIYIEAEDWQLLLKASQGYGSVSAWAREKLLELAGKK